MGVFGVLAAVGLFIIFFALIGIVIAVLFFLNLYNLLNRVQPQNRAMTPGYVFLNFIPVFNLFWSFYTVIKVRDSLRAEYSARQWPPDGDFAYTIGIAFVALSIAGGIISSTGSRALDAIGGLFNLAAFILWILYWVRTNSFKNKLGPANFAAMPPQGYNPPQYGGPGSVPPYQAPQPPQYQAPQPPAYGAQYQPQPQSQPPAPQPPVQPQVPKQPASAPVDEALQAERGSGSCGACGAPYGPDDQFCRSCGIQIPNRQG